MSCYELQQQLVEYLDPLPQNTQITWHKEAFTILLPQGCHHAHYSWSLWLLGKEVEIKP